MTNRTWFYVAFVLFLAIGFQRLCAESENGAPTDWFVDSVQGNDDNDGRSEAAAWRTLFRVNRADVKPGDRVLLKRGSTFRGQLRCKNGEPDRPIVYSAYGEGDKPLLLGSVDLSDKTAWSPSSEHPEIWVADPWAGPDDSLSDGETADGRIVWDSREDVGNLIVIEREHSQKGAGFKRWSLEDLKSNGDFFLDGKTGRLFLFSDVHPGERYRSIEAAIRRDVVTIGRYIVIDSLAVENGASHGVGGGKNVGIVVKNCDFAWIGGGNLYAGDDGKNPTRYGNGVEFFNGARDCRVENNKFSHIYDVAMTIQGPDPCLNENLVWRNNLVYRCTQAFEIWFTHKDAAIRNARFERNTCVDSGVCWGWDQRPDKRGTPLLAYRLNLKEIDLRIEGNLFCNGTDTLLDYVNHRVPEVRIDHNLWWSDAFDGPDGMDAKLFTWMSGEADQRIPHSFEEYRKLSGNDSHSSIQRPRFADPDREDYRILNRAEIGDFGAAERP